MTQITRRRLLAATAAAPFAAPLAAVASAPMMGASFARHHRFTLGGFEVTTILAGTTPREDPHSIFGLNVSDEEFAEVSEDHFLSTEEAQFFFTPTVVNTGSELVLFDTGLNGAGTTQALASAGYTPDQIDVVVLTHMHGDHIGGLMTDGAPTFPNARYVTGQTEWDYWAGAENEGFEANVRPFADQMTFLTDGQDAVTGISAHAAFGHTPGHMVFRVSSEDKGLMIMGDLANHAVWSLAHPEWEVLFDSDKAMAAESRRRVLDMAAADRIPAIFYHLPFPALGHVETSGDAFRWVPAAGQFMG
ncbi:MBL fold metallo-hydrolase [Rhodobacterales bacterium HKCCE3408]|nr:MBL fold metallo-hydrolase [Rhodobacterales bacterium HKCCE3408]